MVPVRSDGLVPPGVAWSSVECRQGLPRCSRAARRLPPAPRESDARHEREGSGRCVWALRVIMLHENVRPPVSALPPRAGAFSLLSGWPVLNGRGEGCGGSARREWSPGLCAAYHERGICERDAVATVLWPRGGGASGFMNAFDVWAACSCHCGWRAANREWRGGVLGCFGVFRMPQ